MTTPKAVQTAHTNNVELIKFANAQASFICEAMLNFKAADGSIHNKLVFVLIKRDASNKAVQTLRYYMDVPIAKVLMHDLWNKVLGRETIPAIIQDGDELTRELTEIDENLIRNELSALEQGEHLIRRNEILEALGLRAQAGDNQHQSGHAESARPQTTENIAKEVGMSKRTAQERMQIARNLTPEVRNMIRDTELADSKGELLKLSRLEPEKQKAVALQVVTGEVSDIDSALNGEAIRPQDCNYRFSSEHYEWYTPEKYIEVVREFLGGIDLDPASCEKANQVIRASRFFTETDDGLARAWFGRVFCNPPYGVEGGVSHAGLWTQKMIDEYRSSNISEGILLVGNSTEKKWFQPLWDYILCFTNHRIRFYNHDGEGAQPTHGNAFVYFGCRVERFAELFSDFGAVVGPRRTAPDHTV